MEPTRTSILSCAPGTPRDRKNMARVHRWMLTWMLTFLAITAAVKFEWIPTGPVAIVLTLVCGAFGVVTLIAYRHFLREADELRRKIELEALALALGAGLVGGITLWLLQRAELALVAEADILTVVLIMMLANGLGNFLGQRRYS